MTLCALALALVVAPSLALADDTAGGSTPPEPLASSLDGAALDDSGATLRVDSPAGPTDVRVDYDQLLRAAGAGFHDGHIGLEDLVVLPFVLGIAFRAFSYLSRLSRL
jgi:hypothetical protein